MKRLIVLLCALALVVTAFAGCAPAAPEASPSASAPADSQPADSTPPASPDASEPAAAQPQTLKVAALESAYGADVWQEIKSAFEASHEGVTVELTISKTLEDVISPNMKAGNYPDVVHLAVGRPAALTETLIKENALASLQDVLSMTVPGESAMVSDKIIPGFTDTSITNPYPDGQTYLAPMFYGPCGLFYNAGLFKQKGWEVPTTWDEMWALGDKAKAEGIALFTYPTTGYLDAFTYGLMMEISPDFFDKATHYAEGVWDSPEAKQLFDLYEKLAKYTEPTTPANANNENFTKNQQLVLDNKALFMPNGNWVVGEMAEAPRAEGFEWGFMALPAMSEGGDRYSYTFFEQIWVPAGAQNPDMAKEFVAYMYSDEAAGIFAKYNAIQPIVGIDQKLEGDNKLYYSIYNTGALPAMGAWAPTDPVEGVSIADAMFETFNSIVTGDKTVDQWVEAVKAASDQLRPAMK